MIDKKIYHVLYRSWDQVVDYACTHFDTFCLTLRGRNTGPGSNKNYVRDILSFYPNNLISEDNIVNIAGKNVCILQFKFSSRSIKWLKLHNGWFDFGVEFYKRISKESIKKRYILHDICFNLAGKTIIGTDTFDGLLYVCEEKNNKACVDFYTWAEEITEKANKSMNDIIAQWQWLIDKSATHDEFVRTFADDNYSLDAFFNIFRFATNKTNGWINFYEQIDLTLFAKVIVQKLIIAGNPVEYVSKLYSWFKFNKNYLYANYDSSYLRNINNYSLRTINRMNYYDMPKGSQLITEYILSLPQDCFLEAFKYSLQHRQIRFADLKYIDTVFGIWDAYGLCLSKIKDRNVIKIKKAWDEIDYKNVDGNNVKRAVLLTWLVRCSYQKDCKKVKKIRNGDYQANKLFMSDYKVDIELGYVLEQAYAYLYGIIHRKDYLKAKENLEIAAQEPSFYDCQYDLARCYLNGWGTEKNVEQAKYWFKKAAENGHPKAQEQLDLLIDNDV